MADAMMMFLGEAHGVNWYWAQPGEFENPGAYYWDGAKNVLCVPHISAPEAPAQNDPMEKLTRIQEELGLYDDQPAQPIPAPWREAVKVAREATEEDAYEMGAKGAPATEQERRLFEAWMRGHCWALRAHWNGSGYVSDAEQGGDLDPRAMVTRQLWAAWRDRAALAQLDALEGGE